MNRTLFMVPSALRITWPQIPAAAWVVARSYGREAGDTVWAWVQLWCSLIPRILVLAAEAARGQVAYLATPRGRSVAALIDPTYPRSKDVLLQLAIAAPVIVPVLVVYLWQTPIIVALALLLAASYLLGAWVVIRESRNAGGVSEKQARELHVAAGGDQDALWLGNVASWPQGAGVGRQLWQQLLDAATDVDVITVARNESVADTYRRYAAFHPVDGLVLVRTRRHSGQQEVRS